MAKKTTTQKTTPPGAIKLPPEVKAADMKYPKYGPKAPRHLYELDFELWYTERFGWCIPTLMIRNTPQRRAGEVERRTYAVAVKDGGLVRIGMGPHVKATYKVFVTEGNRERLKKLLEIREKGAADAGETRDRISTRRARTARRRLGDFGW